MKVKKVVQKGRGLYLGKKDSSLLDLDIDLPLMVDINTNVFITKYMVKNGQSPIIITKPYYL